MRVRLDMAYREPVDRYFWLRDSETDAEVEALQERVRAAILPLPSLGFMILDPAVAGHAHDPQAILDVVPKLPPDIAGVVVRESLAELAAALMEAPPAPGWRRQAVEEAVADLDPADLADAVTLAADRLGFAFADGTELQVNIALVWSGIPLGGLTGETIHDEPICLVATKGLDRSTLAESIVHEALHAVDMKCEDPTSIVEQLRQRPDGSHQLWHAPYFIASADAVRAVIDLDHVDYGHRHGYYAKVQAELATLAELGIAPGS